MRDRIRRPMNTPSCLKRCKNNMNNNLIYQYLALITIHETPSSIRIIHSVSGHFTHRIQFFQPTFCTLLQAIRRLLYGANIVLFIITFTHTHIYIYIFMTSIFSFPYFKFLYKHFYQYNFNNLMFYNKIML